MFDPIGDVNLDNLVEVLCGLSTVLFPFATKENFVREVLEVNIL